jgi:aspartyl/glutamyl-tRNA(Asn/Gln) amidotransferase C subunit
MKKIDKSVLKDAARRMLFDMPEEQYDTLLDEFHMITKQLELMGNIKAIDEVSPMTFPFDASVTYMREDAPEKPLSKEDALKNAHSVKDGQIKLPRVI